MYYSQTEKMGTKYHELLTELWLRHDLFSMKWWFIVVLNVVFLILLFMLIDRYRLLLISFAFTVTFVLVGLSDEIGSFFDFWSYPHQFIVFTHRMNAVDFAAVPVIMTLIFQYFSKWKSYLFASIIMSAVISFIAIPLFVLFGLYRIEHWHYFYSFLFMIVLFIVSKGIINFVNNRAEKYPH